MDEVLIKNWNEIVPKDGLVYHLGDFAWKSISYWERIREQLNGEIILIFGNHDDPFLDNSRINKLFKEIIPQKKIWIDDICIYMNHYPFLCYGGSYKTEHNVWQLFGHVHSGPNNTGLDNDRLCHCFPTQYDVGVDNNDYAPVSWNKIKEIISNRIANGSIN